MKVDYLFSLTILFLAFSCNEVATSTEASKISSSKAKPRVFVLTDINNVGGDPDDKQSLVHLLWYANELDIRGIVPDYWNGKSQEACAEGIAAYEKDFQALDLVQKGYPQPDTIRSRVAKDSFMAVEQLYQEALDTSSPLYVLIWGQMRTFKKALFQHPEISTNLRVLTIGTGRKYGPKDEVAGEDCTVMNWNSGGRNTIYNDPRFKEMWWLENNWTYNGMFMGDQPNEMLVALSKYDAMGQHIKYVVREKAWAQYFRVGDTPTVLYLIDPENDLDDPTQGSWAGKFKKPFPKARPNYFTDDNATIEWDYEEPCNSWENLKEMYAHNKSTLHERRAVMYDSLIAKLDQLYNK